MCAFSVEQNFVTPHYKDDQQVLPRPTVGESVLHPMLLAFARGHCGCRRQMNITRQHQILTAVPTEKKVAQGQRAVMLTSSNKHLPVRLGPRAAQWQWECPRYGNSRALSPGTPEPGDKRLDTNRHTHPCTRVHTLARAHTQTDIHSQEHTQRQTHANILVLQFEHKTSNY